MAFKKGTKFSEEHKKKLSDAAFRRATPEYRKRMSESIKNSKKHRAYTDSRIGHPLSEYHLMKLNEAVQKFHDNEITHNEWLQHNRDSMKRRDFWLEKNPNWQGGISFEPYCPKFNEEFKERVRAFFDHVCILCGNPNKRGKKLCVHHVEYNKMACCDGLPVHFAALCDVCHGKTNGNRERWEAIIHRIIDEMYNGRSYYTKDEYYSKDV